MAKTARPMVRIHDLATDELIDREMNDDEYAEWETQQAAQAQAQADAEAKAAAREETIAKLAALGLTPEDLAAL
jgi:hypothetical protein